MKTFVIGIALLFVGGAIYSKFIEKVFNPDDRITPAFKKSDGVDFVAMGKWRNALINLLNIAGTGPILGPIQGILFGPIAFITIPIGCVISGATHDYLCAMMSMRQDGAQMPRIIRKFLGGKVYHAYNAFLCILLLLLVAVFTYMPGDLFSNQILGMDGINVWTWVVYGAILAYYLIATIFPIDKIIGRFYPVLGAVLMLSAMGVLIGIFLEGYQLMELDFSNGLEGIFCMYPLWDVSGNTGAGTPFLPVFFVTVACGITSGFHSTQCTLISRSVSHERDGKTVFYWGMIAEGFIALIWAAAAMGIYNAGSMSGSIPVVGEVAFDLLGPVGGLIAVIGVIVLPITSGDTALRSCRLIVADYLNIDQKQASKRIIVSLCILVFVVAILVFAKVNASGFNVLWRYFAWSNQMIAVFAFAAISVYLRAKKGASKIAFLVAHIPGTFYMFVVTSFILSQGIGFGLSLTVSYAVGAIVSVAYFAGIAYLGKKFAKTHEEE